MEIGPERIRQPPDKAQLSGTRRPKGSFASLSRLMKSKHRSRALLLSILCGGVLATFLGGCAEGPYVATYDTGYYPTAYYTPSYYRTYSYYEPAYDTTIVRSGVRYNDAYGPRYYDRT